MRSLTFLVGLSAFTAHAQVDVPPVVWPEIPKTVSKVEALVPADWKLEQTIRKDFNGDRESDALLLLRMDRKENVVTHDGMGPSPLNTNPRMLVIAFGTKTGFITVLVDHTLIPRNDTPIIDDPFDAIVSTSNGFRVKLQFFANAGSWTTSTTEFAFRWEKQCFRLIGYDWSSVHRASGETKTVSANFILGRLERSHQADPEGLKTVERGPTHHKGVLCLQDVGGGLEFEDP